MQTMSQSKTLLLELVALTVLSVALAAGLNYVNPQPLPWLGSGVPAPAVEESSSGEVQAIPNIDTARAMELLQSGEALFVDARYAADFDAGHIPGAVNVAPGLFEDEIAAVLGDPAQAKPLVLYCSSATCPLSHELALGLEFMGYRNISVYVDGWAGWLENGGEKVVSQ